MIGKALVDMVHLKSSSSSRVVNGGEKVDTEDVKKVEHSESTRVTGKEARYCVMGTRQDSAASTRSFCMQKQTEGRKYGKLISRRQEVEKPAADRMLEMQR